MDIFEDISRDVTLFLVDHRIIKESNGGEFDFIFGRIFFFVVTFSLYMLMCMIFTDVLSSFITIMSFNLAYNWANRKIAFHAIKMQNCALLSGVIILMVLLTSLFINSIFSFQFSYIVYNLIISYMISSFVVSTQGQIIFRYIENRFLFTEI